MTEEVKAKRKAAKDRVLAFAKLNKADLKGIADDIQLLLGGREYAIPRSTNSELRAMLLKAGTAGVTELEIFKTFHIGRDSMTAKARALVTCPKPEDRVWITFDEKTEIYKVVGVGANPPAGFAGYIPQDKATQPVVGQNTGAQSAPAQSAPAK